MRIAYVINSLEGGGAAQPVPAVTGLLRDRGAEVRLFALSRRDGRAISALDEAGLDYRVAELRKGQNISAAYWLYRQLLEYRPTLIWTSLTQSTLIGQLLGAICRVPVVSWQHNAFLKPTNLILLRMFKSLSRLWVADSQSVADLTAARLGVHPDEVVVWQLIVTERPAPTVQHRDRRGAFRIGSLGRLHWNKGYDVLIRAVALLVRSDPGLMREFEIVIGGEGEQRPMLEKLIEEEKLHNVILAGFQESPLEFLGECDGYVQPSRAEGLCIAAHEAMQMGLPVIVSEVGEMPRTVAHGESGFVVQPGNAVTLAETIRSMVSDPERAKVLGSAAQREVLSRFRRQHFQRAGNAIFDRVREWDSGR